MKKIVLLSGAVLLSSVLFAQEPADALRFSWTVPGGTARQQALGGAMGALGGDISSAFSNPAGIAGYRTGDLVVTPLLQTNHARATYLGRSENNENTKFIWGTSGFVTGLENQGGKVKGTSFGIALNRTADFNSNILYRGANNQSSYSQKFLDEIGNTTDANHVANDFPFGASLAFNTYWIDTVSGSNGSVAGFQSRAPIATGLLQQQTIANSGGIDEIGITGGVNLNDKVLLGGTFGIPILHYRREATFTEQDATTNANNKFEEGFFSESLTTKGVGFNFRAGVIYRPSGFWRLGLAFHTPTLYSLTDNYSAFITTNTEGYQGEQTQSSTLFTNGGPSNFKYMFVNPYRVIGSVAYIIGSTEDVSQQKGFVTADVEFVNYKASSFHQDPENGNDASTLDYLNSLNTAIDNAYKSAFNIKAGGELKFTTFMVRAGGAYYGNPYQDIHGEKGSKLNLSGGIGYRGKGFFWDLAYVHSIQKDVHFPYRLESAPYSGAQIKSNVGTLLTTIGFKF